MKVIMTYNVYGTVYGKMHQHLTLFSSCQCNFLSNIPMSIQWLVDTHTNPCVPQAKPIQLSSYTRIPNYIDLSFEVHIV